MPFFLRSTLGASYTIIGIIEGVAQGVAVGLLGLAGVLSDRAELARDERVRAAVQEAVDAVNANLARHEQIKRFAILPRDFSMAEGELTPTLKLKRRVCEEHFAAEIEALYS